MTLGRLVHWLLLHGNVAVVASSLLLLPNLVLRHRKHYVLCLLLLLRGALLTGADRWHCLIGMQSVDLLLLRCLDKVVQPDALLELLLQLLDAIKLDLGLAHGNHG